MDEERIQRHLARYDRLTQDIVDVVSAAVIDGHGANPEIVTDLAARALDEAEANVVLEDDSRDQLRAMSRALMRLATNHRAVWYKVAARRERARRDELAAIRRAIGLPDPAAQVLVGAELDRRFAALCSPPERRPSDEEMAACDAHEQRRLDRAKAARVDVSPGRVWSPDA